MESVLHNHRIMIPIPARDKSLLACLATGLCVCVFITGESESQNKEKQIWSYEERR